MKQLGALGWFFYWIVIVTGIYLFIFFDTGITEAYNSVEYLTNSQWYAGGVMRSLHRYASDALVVVVLLHLLREYLLDHHRDARWFAWVTGIALLWFIYASGVSGYWVVWDKLAQYVAIKTTEWLDTLGLFGKPIARNFLNQAALSGRFFTLLIFIHIVVPLFLLLGMWIHIIRHANPKVNPPYGLATGTLVMLMVLSLVYPARSQGPANLDIVPGTVQLDWFYLGLYPLLDRYSGLLLWAFVMGTTLLLIVLPWLPVKRKPAPATVDLGNCNGCARCAADCPYSAITMGPRTDGLPFAQQAVVNPGLCVSCGICSGACPSASPFRRRSALVPGIELPEFPIRELRDRVLQSTKDLSGNGRIVLFGCLPGTDLPQLSGPSTSAITLPCIGMLPPSMIDFIISRGYADGVMLGGCRACDCHYRLGIEWTEQRIARKRDPYLRERIPIARLRTCWSGVSGAVDLRTELEIFRQSLTELAPLQRPRPGIRRRESDHEQRANA
jgi:ferredoxin/coenzyme F420-reducing hydrogenase delta subunit